MTVFETQLGASRQQFSSQVALWNAVGQSSVQALEKLMQLNLAALRASLEEANENSQLLLAAGGPQEAAEFLKSQSGTTVSKVVAYANHVAAITNEAQSQVVKAAEEHVAQNCAQASRLVDEFAKGAPAGSENVIEFVKTSIGTAQSGFEQANRNVRRAAEVVESKVNEASKQFVEPATTQTAQ